MNDLDRRACDAGIAPSFRDYFGHEIRVSDETKRALLETIGDASDGGAPLAPVLVVREGLSLCVDGAPFGRGEIAWEIALEGGARRSGRTTGRSDGGSLEIPAGLPLGYHRLTICIGATAAQSAVIVVPQRCYLPPEIERGGTWALSTQLYALRSRRDWGLGDFGSLAELAERAGAAGCAAIGLNPLHALHSANPAARSPYAPSSRLFLNALYVEIEAVADLAESPQAAALIAGAEFGRALRAVRAAELVDYPEVARLKHAALQLLYTSFCRRHLERTGDARAARFRRFVREGGRALEHLTHYEALDEHFRALPEPRYGWEQWPHEYRSPASAAVRDFARRHRAAVEYHAYVQWLAHEQLAKAARAATRHGVGLYRDLAVGAERNGADTWGDQQTFPAAASLGAPPDPLNETGQNWGLPPLSPRALHAQAFEPFVRLLRANMRHARLLRIDHVMGLQRAFWIPRGRSAEEGAYVGYDLDAMLGIVALESVRNRCVVVGEDLGTVPEGFRERLRDAGVLGSRLIYFERDASGGFLPPPAYPRLAAASIGTHDLPPLAGWWLGTDLGVNGAVEDRDRSRLALIDALEGSGAAGPDCARRLRRNVGKAKAIPELTEATHRFLAATPSLLHVVALEDVLGETGAVNVPGTVDEHPNWRRRHHLAVDAPESDERLFRIGAVMCDTTCAMPETERR